MSTLARANRHHYVQRLRSVVFAILAVLIPATALAVVAAYAAADNAGRVFP